MARITPRQRQRYGPFLTGLVRSDVLKAIDDRELEDRFAQASGLMQQVAKAATPGAGRRFGEQAQRILGARPRAQTEAIVVAKMARARTLAPYDRAAAADLEQQARDELLAHQPAVRRFDPAAVIAKAKAADRMLACFDQGGKLYGVCNPDDVEVLDGGDPGQAPAAQASTGQAPPAGQALPGGDPGAQVAKSSKAGKQKRAVFDQQQRLIGLIDPELVTEVINDLPGAQQAIGKAHARTVARAQGTRVTKAAPAGERVAVFDQAGKLKGYARPEDIASPEAQARNTGPVNAGGTTGMGQPRTTGPDAALPLDGPQATLPGDAQVPGRMVIKAALPPVRTADGRVALLRDLPPRSARRPGR